MAWAVLLAGLGVGASSVEALVRHADELGAPRVFTVNSSNGYSIVAFGSPARDKRPARVTLYVSRPDELAIYSKPARVSQSGMWANFGKLGRVAMRFHPSGKFVLEQPPCERRKIVFRSGFYAGSIVFHGEQGYTGLTARRAKADLHFFLGSLCPGSLKSVGKGPGADLSAVPRAQKPGFGFEAIKNGPADPTYYGAVVREKRGSTLIYRAAGGHTKPSAFDYNGSLSKAIVSLPEPFSGTGIFQRGLGGANSWQGDLSVDLPGRSGLALAGKGFKAKLAPAEYHPVKP
ncbi:MAG TPA: hypothetical protein VII45_09195 [Solirubrobacterales bacterium]